MKPSPLLFSLCLAYGHVSAATYADQLMAAARLAHPGVQAVVVAPGAAPAEASQVRAGGLLITSLPLQDMSGDPVGAMTVTSGPGAEADALSEALAIRDAMRRHIVNAANLRDPVPYVADAPSAPYAQQLVEQMMLAHPELLVMALHVALPQGGDYPIIASSIGRIGKHADEDDLRVIHTGQPALGVYGAAKARYGIELPMYDRSGALIGALSIGYRYHSGEDEVALLRLGRALEAELRARIPSLASLYGPVQ